MLAHVGLETVELVMNIEEEFISRLPTRTRQICRV